MGAPENNPTPRVCDRCFASLAPDAEFCVECGAPVPDAASAEGSDGTIYPQLARANLFRMRGDYRQAEEICLAILRRYPNNATANALLGDISQERGDLEQAAEWYDLALDLTPDSVPIRQKLTVVKERMAERDTANTAKQLGLPTTRPKIGLYVFGVLAFLLGTGAAAFYLGRNWPVPESINVVEQPLELGATRRSSTEPEAPPQAQPSTRAAAPLANTDTDRALIEAVAQRNPSGSAVLDIDYFPRGQFAFVTYSAGDEDDPRVLGASIASSVLEQMPECQSVVLRAIRHSQVVFIADVTRESVALTAQTDWQTNYSKVPGAFADAVLSREWTPNAPALSPTDSETRPVERGGEQPGD